ncbi:MAG: hypothetical protein AAF840_04215 [Bacteroidota bacterium]
MPYSSLLLKNLFCTRVLALLTIILCFSQAGTAQLGLHPPTVDFQQIRTSSTRILFPAGYEARAQRVAALVDAMRANHTRSIGDRHYDFDLVLQTPNTAVNGYVGLAPFRSEFFVTPPQSMNLLSGGDWVDLLTIHEFRHVQQNSNERRGITGLFAFLQGQYGWAVASGIATPNWFSEGDAVIFETALTQYGRGRTPAFSGTLRSLLANDEIYPYAKARNGSFRSLVPDHYRYGYAMVTFAREHYGNDVWRSILQDGASYKGLFYPFSRALKKKTGYSTTELYEATMADLKAMQDSSRLARPNLVEGVPYGHQPPQIRTYRFPFKDKQGRVVAMRSGFDVLPSLVAIDPAGGKDKVITSIGIQREPYLDVRGDLVTWMENRQHPRYTNLGYSDIMLYEMGSVRRRQLTTNGKYFSPSFSFDRRQLVAVYQDPLEGPPAIVILDTSTGKELKRYPQDAQAVSYPRFSPDGKTIYFYHRAYDGVAIKALDLASESVAAIMERNYETVDYLQVCTDGQLLFTSGRDGIDNVYQLDPTTGNRRQLTNASIGAWQPYLDAAGHLFYTEPTPRGHRLRHLDLTEQQTKLGSLVGLAGGLLPANPSFFERPAAFADEAYNLVEKVEVKDYPISDFNDKLGGIKLHSWSFNGSYVSPGLTVEARNALNTVAIGAQTEYNINEERTTAGVTIEYGGWYPTLTLAANTRGRAYSILDPATDTVIFNRFEYNQQRVSLSAAIPWQWVNGDYRTTLRPGVGYTWNRLANFQLPEGGNTFSELNFRLAATVAKRIARQQVQSRFGASLLMAFDRALADDIGQRFLLRSSVFLPGLHRTHGIRIDADFQSEDIGNIYQFPDNFLYPRGYGASANDQVTRIGFNYQLPLLYPDFGIAGITYFQRVRLNAFYDIGQRKVNQFNFTQNFHSVGGQLFFDNRWLNAQDITVGVETAYLLDAARLGIQNQVQFRLLVTGGF